MAKTGRIAGFQMLLIVTIILDFSHENEVERGEYLYIEKSLSKFYN